MNVVLSLLVLAAIVAIHVLAGGRQPALSLPSYGILGVAAVLSWWPMRRIEIPRRVAPCIAAAFIFFGYVIIRTIFSPEEYLARKDLHLMLAALTVYLLVALNLTASELRARLVVVLLVLATAHVAVGVVQFARADNFSLIPFLPRPEYGWRASGLLGYPNHLAAFLEVVLLLGLGLAFWGRWRPWAKITVGYFVATCIAGIVLTGSRGGFVSTLAGLLVFCALSLLVFIRRMQKPSPFLVAGVIVAAAVLAFSIQRGIRDSAVLHERAKWTPDTHSARVMLWRVAIQQFQSHPATGAGSRMFLYHGREFKPLGIQADPEYAHNEYLQFLAEYGLIGGIGFCLFLAAHLRGGWRAFQHTISRAPETLDAGSNSLALNIGALSAVAACLVHASVDYTLHSPAVTLVMAFVFGTLAHPGGEADLSADERPQGFRLGRHFRLATPALGLCLLVFALPKLPAELYAERARLILSDWRYLETPELARAAARLAQRGIPHDPGNPELHYCLGEALMAQAVLAGDATEKERHYGGASLAYLKALAAAPRDSRLLLCLASALDALGRFDESAPLYAEAIRRDPISKYAHWAHAHHFELQQKLDEAEAAYTQSLRLGSGLAAELGLDRVAKLRKAQAPAPPAPPDRAP